MALPMPMAHGAMNSIRTALSKAFVPFRGLVGDLNHDGNVDITDIVLLVNYILGDANAVVDEYEADINSDGSIDVTDVVLLVNIQLGI